MSIISLWGHGSDGIQYVVRSLYSRICCISNHQVLEHSFYRPPDPQNDPLSSGLIRASISCSVCTGRGSRNSKNYTLGNSTNDAISFLDAPVNDLWTSTLIVLSCSSLPGFCDLRIA